MPSFSPFHFPFHSFSSFLLFIYNDFLTDVFFEKEKNPFIKYDVALSQLRFSLMKGVRTISLYLSTESQTRFAAYENKLKIYNTRRS